MNRLPHPDVISFVPEAPLGIPERGDRVVYMYILGDNVVYCCTCLSGREINEAVVPSKLYLCFSIPQLSVFSRR